MSESTEQIGKLWTNLSELRSIVGDTPAITRLQSLIASIDERLGQLDRAVQERIALVAARDKAINHIPDNDREPWRRPCAPQATPRSGLNDPALVRDGLPIAHGCLCRRGVAVSGAGSGQGRRDRPFAEILRRRAGAPAELGNGHGRRGGAGSDPALPKIMQAAQAHRCSARARTACFRFAPTNWRSKPSPATCNCRCSNVVTDMEAQVNALVYARRRGSGGFQGCCRRRAQEQPLLAARDLVRQPDGRHSGGLALRHRLYRRAAARIDARHGRRGERRARYARFRNGRPTNSAT